VRVVIAEDLFLLREGLVRLLTAHGFEVVAAVASAPELLRALLDERPDVGIVDVRLPPTHTDDGLRDEAFTTAIRSVAAGGTVLDPEVVQKLMVRHSGTEPLTRLTPREHDVLALMAEGRSNAAIAQRLFITEKAVSKHAAGIFAKLDLALSDDDNRRVLAVLAYLES
jgi:DNA-binding NarL/FixJ family response regulator